MNDSIELVVDESTVQSQPISANFAEVEAWLSDKLSAYKGLVITEDTVTEGKVIKANINRLSKAISDRRIAVKKRYLAPFETFEANAKRLCSMCDEVSANIDKQIKVFDEQKKQVKRDILEAHFNEKIGELHEMLSFDSIFNPRWLNATFGEEQARSEIDSAVTMFVNGLSVIRSIGGEFTLPMINKFVETRNLADAMALKETLESQKAQEEQRKAEQEAAKKPQPLPQGDDPFEAHNPSKDEPLVTLRFEVTGTKAQLTALANYMRSNGIKPKRI